jgi:hypothetical protein
MRFRVGTPVVLGMIISNNLLHCIYLIHLLQLERYNARSQGDWSSLVHRDGRDGLHRVFHRVVLTQIG